MIFYNFRKIFGIFGSVRKSSETSKTVQKYFSNVFIIFLNFRKIFGNLRKYSEITGKFPDVIANVCNGSQEFKSLELAFERSSNGPQ